MPDDVIISESISIPGKDLEIAAVRSRGPGGQNVNKVSTAAQLRFDIATSEALPEAVRARLLARSDRRISASGVLVIKASRHRSLERNRLDVIERFVDLMRSALADPVPRKKTRPGQRAAEHRLAEKRRRAGIKKERGRVRDDS